MIRRSIKTEKSFRCTRVPVVFQLQSLQAALKRKLQHPVDLILRCRSVIVAQNDGRGNPASAAAIRN
jgi:hypothetical protein